MALDKLVDSSKLDAALNYEANRILAKTGGTAPIPFDLANEKGFGDIIATIIKPEGIAQISISSNGSITEDIAAYASAQISVAVPNTYAAGDEGKVVSSGALVAQGSATYSSNGLYDTTLVSSINIEVSGVVPSGTISITTNGIYDVTTYASASVEVPGTEPTGTIEITSNGVYDVSTYASASVNTPVAAGTTTVVDNGTYNVAAYASVVVSIPLAAGVGF